MPLLLGRGKLRQYMVLLILFVTSSFLYFFGKLRQQQQQQQAAELDASDLQPTTLHASHTLRTQFKAEAGGDGNRPSRPKGSPINSSAPVPAHPLRLGRQEGQEELQEMRKPSDWPEFFKPRRRQQFSLEYRYLYQADRTCREPVDELVMVLSMPRNFLQRRAIRRTWGSVTKNGSWPGVPAWERLPRKVGLMFLLGEEPQPSSPGGLKALREESEEFGDLVQWSGLLDTYFNLTLKVLMGLKWVSQKCPNVSHVIKTDDDTFVHVQRLLRLLDSGPRTRIWGPYFTDSPSERAGKFRVSLKAYPFRKYPPHVKGNLYVLPGQAVGRMVAVAPYLPYNNMEDVHVTGTLAVTLNLSHNAFRADEFSTFPEPPPRCLFQNNRKAVGSQMVSSELALDMWNSLSDERSCPKKMR